MQDIKKRNKGNNVNQPENKHRNATNSSSPNKMQFNKNISLKILSRVVMIFSLLAVVYFSSKDDKFKTFAKQSELLVGKGLVVECSPSYVRDLDKYEGCFPQECKRFVTDKVISLREADELLVIAKKGLKLGGSSGGLERLISKELKTQESLYIWDYKSTGGASILDLHSGALSKGQQFINIYKQEAAQNLFNQNDFNIYRVVKEKIKYAVAHHFGVNPNKIYLTHPTFFSEITSKKAVTVHDEYWHPHVDKETYQSFHYTTLLYLGDYNIDFKGGRFVFVDEKFNRTVEPRKSRLSMFTSGRENLHYVEKVTSGTRYAMTISFTCDKQHAIEDPSTNKYEIN